MTIKRASPRPAFSVGLVAWLYEQDGFVMLHAFAGLCLLVIAAAIILPSEIKVPAAVS
jgi:hypothetical protein